MSTNVQVTGQTVEHPSYINSTKKKKPTKNEVDPYDLIMKALQDMLLRETKM